jgi:hypothetical protein
VFYTLSLQKGKVHLPGNSVPWAGIAGSLCFQLQGAWDPGFLQTSPSFSVFFFLKEMPKGPHAGHPPTGASCRLSSQPIPSPCCLSGLPGLSSCHKVESVTQHPSELSPDLSSSFLSSVPTSLSKYQIMGQAWSL